ncbi:Inositol-phosphate phosphatase, partial [Cucurbita argyrosperma subsp. sororia]
MSGSYALNLCGVACGRIDLFFEIGFGGPWDVACDTVNVTEAGGLVFDPKFRNLVLMDIDCNSSSGKEFNPLLRDAFVEALEL